MTGLGGEGEGNWEGGGRGGIGEKGRGEGGEEEGRGREDRGRGEKGKRGEREEATMYLYLVQEGVHSIQGEKEEVKCQRQVYVHDDYGTYFVL